ncbi:MAG: site-specific DNA-methyltransferase [Melioribacteraceae bacterium]|nr:site-specific DNA-methyltransferase [Melioribacteraceae bacterium]
MPTLNWIGKEAVEKHHLEIPYRLLEYDDSLSAGDKEAGNLLIQGDNLHALKALLPYYAGEVKCIYIDPPYNTGNENWSYNDNVNSPEIKKWLNDVVGKEGEDLTRHDKWLCMMYPRLQLLKKLLHKSGSIFVSIDENEQSHLKLLMDEIFGAKNFIEQLVWNKRVPKNDKYIGNIHEYILLYAKDINFVDKFIQHKEGIPEINQLLEKLKRKKNPIPESENEIRKLYKKNNYDRGITLYNNLDADYRLWGKINVSWPNGQTYGPRYDILHPITKKPCKVPVRGWRWKEETFNELLDYDNIVELHDGSLKCGRIWFAKDENTQPSSIKYLDEVSFFLLRSIISTKSEGAVSLRHFSNTPFDYPKPLDLIKLLIKSTDLDNALILDSFAGSGTTGQSILELNKEDGGSRKFILIELEENIAINVAVERLKKSINGYNIYKGKKAIAKVEGLGGGFRYCKLSDPLFDQYGNVREGVTFKQLAYHIFFSETGVPLKQNSKLNTPLIGKYKGTAYYLLFNGILGDKTVNGGNVLTTKVLENLPKHNGDKIVFGMASRLSAAKLKNESIVFKQIPVGIKTG